MGGRNGWGFGPAPSESVASLVEFVARQVSIRHEAGGRVPFERWSRPDMEIVVEKTAKVVESWRSTDSARPGRAVTH